jgi:hypothetical protein
MDTICVQTIHHLKEIIELVEKYPNDSDLGGELRLYIKELNEDEQGKSRTDK